LAESILTGPMESVVFATEVIYTPMDFVTAMGSFCGVSCASAKGLKKQKHNNKNKWK
jgi:hypothetical protein